MLYLILLFMPLIYVFGIKIPTLLICLLGLLIFKRIKFDIKDIIIVITTTLIIGIILFTVNVLNEVSIKDISYMLIPSTIYLSYIFYLNITDIIKIDKLIIALKIFMIVQLVLVIMQTFNFLNINEKFYDIFYYFQTTFSNKDTLELFLTSRPFGTIGNPVYLSIIVYIIAKTIQVKDKNMIYTIIAFIIMMFAGARSAVLTFIIAELFILIFTKRNYKPLIIIGTIFGFIIISSIIYNYTSFLKYYVETFLMQKDLSIFLNDYSVTYRVSMFELLLNNPIVILIGGNNYSMLPEYVDSEPILRILQFGIIGYIALLLMHIKININLLKESSFNTGIIIFGLLIFLIINSVTTIIFSSMLFISYIGIFYAVTKKEVIAS